MILPRAGSHFAHIGLAYHTGMRICAHIRGMLLKLTTYLPEERERAGRPVLSIFDRL